MFYVGTQNPSLSSLKLILKDRITTFNECSYLIDYISMKEGLTGQFRIAGTLGALENFMGISPKRRDADKLAALFDRGMNKLRKTGQLKAIMGRYGLTDWKK